MWYQPSTSMYPSWLGSVYGFTRIFILIHVRIYTDFLIMMAAILLLGFLIPQVLARPKACLEGHMLPTVFLLGAQKCGTTSLSVHLCKAFPQLSAGKR
jgi:hypothetical protein